MAKFTSGKWDVSESRGTYYIGDTNRDICGVWTKNPYDARLIAAAPEMYELMDRLVGSNSPNPVNTTEELFDVFAEMKMLLAVIDGEVD